MSTSESDQKEKEDELDLRQWMNWVHQNDQEAYVQFFTRKLPFIYQLTYRLLANIHEAEDVTQQTFMKLLGLRERLKHENIADINEWLCKIAILCTQNMRRS